MSITDLEGNQSTRTAVYYTPRPDARCNFPSQLEARSKMDEERLPDFGFDDFHLDYCNLTMIKMAMIKSTQICLAFRPRSADVQMMLKASSVF